MPKARPEQIVVPKLAEVKPELKPPVLTPKKLPDLMPPKPAPRTPTVGVLQAAIVPPGDGPKMKRPGLRTDVFDGSSAAPTVKRPVSQVQTGGFGDPNGVRGEGRPDKIANVASLGAFDLPTGPGAGNGTGGALPPCFPTATSTTACLAGTDLTETAELPGATVETVNGCALHATAINKFEIAGFQSQRYTVLVVSNLPRAESLNIARNAALSLT